jgi:MFS family permease
MRTPIRSDGTAGWKTSKRTRGREPGQRVPAGEPLRTQRISILEGSLANVHITITSGALVTAYALMLGANDFHLGLISAFIALANAGAILGAQAVGRIRSRKPVSVVCSGSGRVLWGFLCFLPFLPLSTGTRLVLFLGTILAGNSLVNVSGTAWLSWMTDIVPLAKRGRYFGVRNTITGAVAMVVTYGTGRFFDLFVARGQRAEGLAVIFGGAAFFALLAAIVLTRQWEPPVRGEAALPIHEIVRRPFTERRFRCLLAFNIPWSMATGMAGPFFAAHMIRNLHMSFSVIAVYSIVAGVMSLFTQPLWGRIIDRLGNRPVLVLNMIGIGFLPLLWLFATPNRLLPIWIDAFFTGICWPGFTLAAFNLVLNSAPQESRTAYLGMQTMAVGISTFAASLLGGIVAHALDGFHLVLLGQTFVNFDVLFASSSLARLALLPLALRLREEKAQPVMALLDLVGDKVLQRCHTGIHSGVAIIRRIGG